MSKRSYDNESSAGPSATPSSLTMRWTRYPQSLSHEYYAAIGEVCRRWAWLEFQLGVIAREALGLSKSAGFAITGGMSMRSISTVLTALSLGEFPKGHPQLAEAIGRLGKKLGNIGDMRNEYAHALWGYENEENPKLGIYKFRRPEDRVELNWIHKPLTAIQADAEVLAQLQQEAQRITTDLKQTLRRK